MGGCVWRLHVHFRLRTDTEDAPQVMEVWFDTFVTRVYFCEVYHLEEPFPKPLLVFGVEFRTKFRLLEISCSFGEKPDPHAVHVKHHIIRDEKGYAEDLVLVLGLAEIEHANMVLLIRLQLFFRDFEADVQQILASD